MYTSANSSSTPAVMVAIGAGTATTPAAFAIAPWCSTTKLVAPELNASPMQWVLEAPRCEVSQYQVV
jgi:hypothetical protein